MSNLQDDRKTPSQHIDTSQPDAAANALQLRQFGRQPHELDARGDPDFR
jgi:hypothetical protein